MSAADQNNTESVAFDQRLARVEASRALGGWLVHASGNLP
jgi:hypothetical protein